MERLRFDETYPALQRMLGRLGGPDAKAALDELERISHGNASTPYILSKCVWQHVSLVDERSGIEWQQLLSEIPSIVLDNRAVEVLTPLLATNAPGEHRLVRMKVRDLGLSNGSSYEEILGRAVELELRLCDPHVGPALRSSYVGQPEGEQLFVAMEPLPDTNGGNRIFELIRDHGILRLRGVGAGMSGKWGDGATFLFEL